MPTSLYGLATDKAAGDTLDAAEVNLLGDTAELFYVQLGELFGPGFYLTTDCNGTAVSGALALEMSAGSAFVGGADARKLVRTLSPSTVTGLASGATHYVYLGQDGEYVTNTTGVAPDDTLLACTAVTNSTEVTSVHNAPTGRTNLGQVLCTLRDVDGATLEYASSVLRIKDGGVTSGKLADSVVATAKIADTAVSTAKLADNAVTTAKIPDSAITSAKLGSSAVTTAKIADSQVTTAKIADSAVATAKIADTAVTAAKLAATVAALLQGTPTLTVGAKVGSTINVAVQLKDLAGTNLAVPTVCRVWLSDTAGGAVTASAPDGAVAIGTNGVLLDSHQAKTHLVVASSASGAFDLDLTHSGSATFYLNLEHAGRLFSSAAITF